MQTADQGIIEQLLDWLAQGQNAWLCTVVETWGSSPRPAGSMMALNARGESVGSLSGGCVEEELVAALLAGEVNTPACLVYGQSPQQAQRLQLPCGGRLVVLVEAIDKSLETMLCSMSDALAAWRPITRVINFDNNHWQLTDRAQPFACHYRGMQPQQLTHTLGPVRCVFVIGVSDVSIALAELALWMGYQVTVCDPRQDKIDNWPVAGCETICRFPDEALADYVDHHSLSIVALTHDPRIDDMGLMAAFDSQACYIGAMGSRRTSEKRRERLCELGISEQQLARLQAPIGLDIGSKRPREIALAVMADITRRYAL